MSGESPYSATVAMPTIQCPLEPSRFMELLRSKPLMAILQEIENHTSTSKQCYHPPLKDIILHGPLDGTTPLLLACHYGALNCVKHIVENWGVDLQAASVHYYADRLDWFKMIGAATPLFAAAYNRHLSTVKYLVGRNADVFSKASSKIQSVNDGLTPLHGAFIGNIPAHWQRTVPIVRFLLQSEANPNLRDSSGDTIIHFLTKKSSSHQDERGIAVIELLLQNGASPMARNKSGFTPVLYAANSRNWTVLDFFLESNLVSQTEKIEAMEMAAAQIFWERHSNNDLDRAFRYLFKALLFRQTEPGPLRPTLYPCGQFVGWTNTAELGQVLNQPSEYELISYLIQLRICSDRSKEAVLDLYELLPDVIDHLKARNRLNDLLCVLWATLETIDFPRYLHLGGLWRMMDIIVKNIIWGVSQLDNDDPNLSAHTIKAMLKLVLEADRLDSRSTDVRSQSHLNALLQMVTFLAGPPDDLIEILNEEQKPCIKDFLDQLVSHDSRSSSGQSLLHVACDNQHIDLAIIRLLLEVNADPNAVDENGNAPLHVLASKRHGNGQVIASAARLLLENGAHLDRANKERKTAAQLWKEKNVSQHLPNWLLEPGMVPKLQCLCARAIRSNNVPFKERPDFPPSLHPFVEIH